MLEGCARRRVAPGVFSGASGKDAGKTPAHVSGQQLPRSLGQGRRKDAGTLWGAAGKAPRQKTLKKEDNPAVVK